MIGDISVARALHRLAGEEHCDLVVVGSSREAPEGQIRIGKHTRQLLGHFDCGLAVAARGLHAHAGDRLTTIGVGYDGGAESRAALAAAAALAEGAGAELRVCAVVDDRVPVLLRSAWSGLVATEWHDVMAEENRLLREQADEALADLRPLASAEVLNGSPARAMLELSRECSTCW